MNKFKRPFYMELTEHFFRLAVRVKPENVKGAAVQKWHRNTNQWINENCTKEEAALIRELYTYNQSVSSCSNYNVVKQIGELAARYAADMGLR